MPRTCPYCKRWVPTLYNLKEHLRLCKNVYEKRKTGGK